jgi:hypothetical protein
MTNPLDYTIQDPDAMRYALMANDSAGMRKGGAVKMAGGGPVWNDSGRMVSPDGTLDQFAQSQFGLDPTRADRLEYLPQPARTSDGGRDWTDWIAPEWMVGLQRNIATPEYLRRGNPMTDDQLGNIANSTAIHTSGGGLGLRHIAPAPKGSLGVSVQSNAPPELIEHFHGSDTKGLTELNPDASKNRRSKGSSVWFKNNRAEAAEYVKKNNGVVYTVPLDTSNFAVVDANFTSNKAIHPDAVIHHSNGETTPVNTLGEKVTTDAIAAHSRAKGDPGVRILNVGDKGSGSVRVEEPYGESIAVHGPVKPTAERTLKEIEPYLHDSGLNEIPIATDDGPIAKRKGGRVTFTGDIDAMKYELVRAK